MAKNLEDVIEKAEKYVEELTKLLQELSDNFDKIEKNIIDDACNKTIQAVDNIYNNSVLEFYSKYEPKYYDRLETLFDMYDIKRKGSIIKIYEGPEAENFASINSRSYPDKKTQHRVNAEYLFDQVYSKGYHGGATYTDKLDLFKGSHPGRGHVGYRTPATGIKRIQDKDGNYVTIPRFGLWSSTYDIKSDAPKSIAYRHLMNFNNGNNENFSDTSVNEIARNAINKEFSKYELFKK